MIASDDEIVFRSIGQEAKSSPLKNSQPPSATKIAAKGRKSLGRRVSFAATARVCVFNESTEESLTNKEELAFRREIDGEGNDQFDDSPDDEIILNNKTIVIDDDMSITETSPNPSHVRRISRVDSFEITVKDQQTSSSISEHLKNENDEDMDLTRCVGGLLRQMDEQTGGTNTNTNNSDINDHQSDNEMNYTTCIKETILGTIEKRDSISSVDTAELISFISNKRDEKEREKGKRNVSSMISSLNFHSSTTTTAATAAAAANTTTNNDDNSAANEEMEMTTCVGGLFKSPHSSSLMSAKKKFPSSPDFIGNQERPAAFNYASIMSPAIGINHKNNKKEIDEEEEHENENAANSTGINASHMKHSKQLQGSKTKGASSLSSLTTRLPISSSSSLASSKQAKEVDSLFETFMDTEKVEGDFAPSQIVSQQSSNDGSVVNTLPSSSSVQESPTVSLILPRASLQDFLIETGLRFMDNFSSLERRLTQNIPRDLEPLTEGQKAYYASALLPTVDILESGCNDLIGIIGQMQQINFKLENQFNHCPPLPYLQYIRGDSEKKTQIITRMRGIKNASRIEAKSQWYQWREGMQNPLNDTLQANVSSIEEEHAHVTLQHQQIKDIISLLEPELQSHVRYLERLLTIDKMSKNGELEAYLKMKSDLYIQKQKLQELNSELSLLSDQSTKLKEDIDNIQKNKVSLLSLLDSNAKSIQSLKVEPTDDVILEVKSQVSLHESIVGWELDHLNDDNSLIRIKWLRGGGGLISEFSCNSKRKKADNENDNNDHPYNNDNDSWSHQLYIEPNSISRSNSLFNYADKIITIERGNSSHYQSNRINKNDNADQNIQKNTTTMTNNNVNHSNERNIKNLLCLIDKFMIDIYSIDRQLESLPTFDIIAPQSLSDDDNDNNLTIRLPFFYPELKTKFDVDFKIVTSADSSTPHDHSHSYSHPHSSTLNFPISLVFHSLNYHYGNSSRHEEMIRIINSTMSNYTIDNVIRELVKNINILHDN